MHESIGELFLSPFFRNTLSLFTSVSGAEDLLMVYRCDYYYCLALGELLKQQH